MEGLQILRESYNNSQKLADEDCDNPIAPNGLFLPFFHAPNGEYLEGSQYSGGFEQPLSLHDDTLTHIQKIKEFAYSPQDTNVSVDSEDDKIQVPVLLIRKLILNLKDNQGNMKEESFENYKKLVTEKLGYLTVLKMLGEQTSSSSLIYVSLQLLNHLCESSEAA